MKRITREDAPEFRQSVIDDERQFEPLAEPLAIIELIAFRHPNGECVTSSYTNFSPFVAYMESQPPQAYPFALYNLLTQFRELLTDLGTQMLIQEGGAAILALDPHDEPNC